MTAGRLDAGCVAGAAANAVLPKYRIAARNARVIAQPKID
jgi:hypothetical protein